MFRDKNDDGQQPEGAALWAHYVRDIKPIKGKRTISDNPAVPKPRKTKIEKAKAAQADKANIPALKAEDVFFETMKPAASYEKDASSYQIDRNTAEKLRKGQIPIDARIDLHGLYQIQARQQLLSFIEQAYHRNLRCVLVVTGKGRLILDEYKYSHDKTPGVIKRNFKNWLAQEPHASMILKIQRAQIKDGGEGAYYILLRKKR